MAIGAVTAGSPVHRTVELFDARETPRKVVRVQCSDPARIAARFLPSAEVIRLPDDAGRGVLIGTIELAVDASMPGLIASDVLIYLDDGMAAPDAIRITGRVVAPIEVSPSVLFLPRASASGPLYSGECLVRSTAGDSLTLAVDHAPKGVSVAISDAGSESPGTRRVKLEVTQDFLNGDEGDGTISVQLSAIASGRRHDLSIPIRLRRSSE